MFQTPNNNVNNSNNHPNPYYQNYKIVEKKRKVFYFSKYTIETPELFQIAKTIKTIKENLFKTLLDAMKYCVTGKKKLIFQIF